jgi:hypothetical protein
VLLLPPAVGTCARQLLPMLPMLLPLPWPRPPPQPLVLLLLLLRGGSQRRAGVGRRFTPAAAPPLPLPRCPLVLLVLLTAGGQAEARK